MTDTAASGPRLFVPDALTEGAAVPLSQAQAHYLRDVMRLAPGAAASVFNGRDGIWTAAIASLGKGKGELAVGARIAAQRAEPDVWLLFAPIKSARLDFLLEKAVELGVSALQPVLTQHTQNRRVNLERIRAQAIEAAEQCERHTVPEVRPPRELTEILADWPAGRRLWYGDETGGGTAALAAFSAAEKGAPHALLVGPEGGFSARELDVLRSASFSNGVGLGPRILRAETAAVAVLTLWQAVLGDGGTPPER